MLFICTNRNLERADSFVKTLSDEAREFCVMSESLVYVTSDNRIFLKSRIQLIEFFSIEELDDYLTELYYQTAYAKT